MIKKAKVVADIKLTDQWYVDNKDPNLVYKWGRKSDSMEMNIFAQRGYKPAMGKEKIVRNPFESAQDEEGKTKERGERILMCCPKELVEAREEQRLSRHVKADQAAQNDARRMMKAGRGFTVKSEASEETKRESGD